MKNLNDIIDKRIYKLLENNPIQNIITIRDVKIDIDSIKELFKHLDPNKFDRNNIVNIDNTVIRFETLHQFPSRFKILDTIRILSFIDLSKHYIYNDQDKMTKIEFNNMNTLQIALNNLWQENNQLARPQFEANEADRVNKDLMKLQWEDNYYYHKFDEIITKKIKGIIKESANDLKIWWDSLSDDTQSILKHAIGIQGYPSDIELIKMSNIKNFNASHFDLKNINGLFRLINLETCILRNTSITVLDPLQNLKKLKELDITFTFVQTLRPIWDLPNLAMLRCKRTPKIPYEEITTFIKEHPKCKVFWDYETGQHRLDFINLDTYDNEDQSTLPFHPSFQTNK